jgi:hypothetical protein
MNSLNVLSAILAAIGVGLVFWAVTRHAITAGREWHKQRGLDLRHQLLGEAMLSATRGDLRKAYAAVEREYQRNETPPAPTTEEAVRLLMRRYKEPPRPTQERIREMARNSTPEERADVPGIRLVQTTDGVRKQLVMESPDPCDWVPSGADWRRRS